MRGRPDYIGAQSLALVGIRHDRIYALGMMRVRWCQVS